MEVVENLTNKIKGIVKQSEVDAISRAMTAWVNTFPDKPVGIINYEFLNISTGDETAMALSTIQGTYITRRYLLGGYRAEYQFKLIYRIKPGNSNDKRLKADEMLNQFGEWAMTETPNLGENLRAIRVEPASLSSKFAAYSDGYEDYQILMRMIYEVNV